MISRSMSAAGPTSRVAAEHRQQHGAAAWQPQQSTRSMVPAWSRRRSASLSALAFSSAAVPHTRAPRLFGRAAAPRPRRRAWGMCRASLVDAESARKLLDGSHFVLDIRTEQEWDDGHITKPAKRAANAPFAVGQDGSHFVAQLCYLTEVCAKFSNRATKLIVMCADGGEDSAAAVALLQDAGFATVAQMEGGYDAYSKIWGPSGKRRPPAGRWVSTGKEALKSGLNIPGVAESYDEGGNLVQARYAKGLPEGESLL